MIRLENISKNYPGSRGASVPVLRNIDLTIGRGERIGILGRNGAGKSTLIRLVSGSERPSSGCIERQMSVSWPLAFGGAFLGRLTGYDNFKFVCRLYNVDPSSKVAFVEDFSELGRYFREPLRTYSAGMRARLAFAVSMAVEFDCFLIDEIIAVGDSRFQAKCHEELFVKRADRALLIVSHHADFVREYCTSASILEAGVLRSFPSVDAAYEVYSAQQAMRPPIIAATIGDVEDTSEPSRVVIEERSSGALMEERAQSLAEVIFGLDQDGIGHDMLPSVAKAFANELGDFSMALRVIDIVRAMGNQSAAINLARAVGHLHGKNSLYHVVLGDLLVRNERVKEAISAYRMAVELEPHSFWAQRNLGIALFDIGCYAQAGEAFEFAARLGASDTLKREISRYVIDCKTYLDGGALSGLPHLSAHPGDNLEEVTAVSYPGLGVVSVRVQGFRLAGRRDDSMRIAIEIGSSREIISANGHASNSFRRYAEFSGGDSHGSELIVRHADRPDQVKVTLLIDGEPVDHRVADVRVDGRSPAASCDVAGNAAEAASKSYAAHDYEACALFAGLALADGLAIDHEAYAESLIALGRYHDAEHHLAGLFAAATAGQIDAQGGKLFDLLCVEIARSRLPGWRNHIQSLIDNRLAIDPDSVCALTNQGHLSVDDQRIPDAIGWYAKAAQTAGDLDIIHFNRGIFSAQFAQFDDVSGDEAAQNASAGAGLVHLISCDATYFKRYGPAVVRSSRNAIDSERTMMHVHIIDPDVEALELARELQRTYSFNVTTDFFPFDDAPRHVRIAYYTAGRFLVAPKLLDLYQKPILITETDCLINWAWGEIVDWCGNSDFGSMQSALSNLVPWTKIPAGIVYFDNGQHGIRMARDVRDFLLRVFGDADAHRHNLWTIDQVALWLAWQRNHEAVNAVHLPMYSMLKLATGDKTNIL